MNEVLVCRGCRHPLLDESGCALCLSVKPHLMPVDAIEDEHVPLAQLAQESASLLRAQLKQLKVKQKAATDYEPVLAKESREHSNALAKLLDASRKVVQDGIDAVEVMSFKERADLFKEWFSSLPPAYRRQLHEELEGKLITAAPKQPIQPEEYDSSYGRPN